MAGVRAATLVAPGRIEIREYPFPADLETGAVLLRMIASGICGTDKHTFRGETVQYAGTAMERTTPFPVIQGHENLGVVLQARLRRTLDDVHALADLRPSVRLCKGIYLEPGTIAFSDYEAVRANFVRCLDALLDAGSYVAVATHDEWLIGESLARISRRGLGPLEYELQMLLGVREARRDELVAEGHRLRVYVPFGEHWYGYSLRRLQENPAMAGTIAKATAGRVLRLGVR